MGTGRHGPEKTSGRLLEERGLAQLRALAAEVTELRRRLSAGLPLEPWRFSPRAKRQHRERCAVCQLRPTSAPRNGAGGREQLYLGYVHWTPVRELAAEFLPELPVVDATRAIRTHAAVFRWDRERLAYLEPVWSRWIEEALEDGDPALGRLLVSRLQADQGADLAGRVLPGGAPPAPEAAGAASESMTYEARVRLIRSRAGAAVESSPALAEILEAEGRPGPPASGRGPEPDPEPSPDRG